MLDTGLRGLAETGKQCAQAYDRAAQEKTDRATKSSFLAGK